MPFLTTWMISMACANVPAYQKNQYACTQFMDTGVKKTLLYGADQKTEDYYTIKAKATANDTFGSGTEEIIGGGAYGYRAYRRKAIDLKLPNEGLANSVTMHVSPGSYGLGFGWKMPWL